MDQDIVDAFSRVCETLAREGTTANQELETQKQAEATHRSEVYQTILPVVQILFDHRHSFIKYRAKLRGVFQVIHVQGRTKETEELRVEDWTRKDKGLGITPKKIRLVTQVNGEISLLVPEAEDMVSVAEALSRLPEILRHWRQGVLSLKKGADEFCEDETSLIAAEAQFQITCIELRQVAQEIMTAFPDPEPTEKDA